MTRGGNSHEQGATHPYLKAKPRVGSCKNPVSFAPALHVFHHDDVPEARRQRVLEVKEWASNKLLSVERGSWSKSTKPDVLLCERRQAENLARDRNNPYAYNYRAETLDYAKTVPPIDKGGKFRLSRQTESEVLELTRIMEQDRVQRGIFKRTEEMPTHPKLVGAPQWDNTVVWGPQQQAEMLDRLTIKSRQWTSRVNKTIGETKEYVPPIDQVRRLNESLRQQKAAGTLDLKKSLAHTHTVEEPVDRRSLRNRLAIEPSRKYTTFHHSGTWEYNPIEKRHMWSDTGSFVFDSRGDVKLTVNPDAYNVEGITQPSVPFALRLESLKHHVAKSR